MRKNTITINGEVFELFRTSVRDKDSYYCGAFTEEIYVAYARPSVRKVNIWKYWCAWCHELMEQGIQCDLSIGSHNCQQFTIHGKVRIGDNVYRLIITKGHNRAYMVE